MADLLRDAMKEKQMSQRKLARELAGEGATEQKREHKRRQIGKWLKGTRPGTESARRLAEVLEKPADYFVTRGQPTDLEALRAFVEEQLTEALARIARLEKRLGPPPQRPSKS